MRRSLSVLVGALQGYVILGGLLSLAGWVADVHRLTDWLGTGISIQPNTCIAAAAAGLGVALLGTRFRRTAATVGSVVALLGISVIFQYLSGVSLGIDALLTFERSWGRVGVTHPGRMGPAAAVSWTLLGTAILLASRPVSSELRRWAPTLGLITASVSALGLLGYLYGSSPLYSVPQSTAIALQTGSFVFAVSVGLVVRVPEHGPMHLLRDENAGGLFARRMLPPLVLVPILIGFVRLEGERADLYDAAFGTSIRTLSEILLFGLLVWWTGLVINRHERRRAAADELRQKSQQALEESRQQLEVLLDKERFARADAERAARLKDEFLATLSHELRTPLNAVIGWTQILRRDLSDRERVRNALEVIERNARQQAKLITDLLDISRVVSGNMALDVQRVELRSVIEAAVDAVLPAASAKDIHILRVLETVSEPVFGDPVRLQQIVWNLLSNAVKFTPRGGRIRVVLARVGSHVEIRVADSGEGIAPDFLPYIFERFRQGDASASRRHGGLGLGLAIVKQFAELHGGEVRAASEGAGKGSTFVIELPLGDSAAFPDASRPSAAELPNPAVPSHLRGIRVLVVDDDPDALVVAQRMLEEQLASVATAAGTEPALALLEQGRFDVIVSDIGMPGRDGYGLIAEARRRGIDTPAIALTAFARAEDKKEALAKGFQAHLSKPLEAEELTAAVAQWATRPEELAAASTGS